MPLVNSNTSKPLKVTKLKKSYPQSGKASPLMPPPVPHSTSNNDRRKSVSFNPDLFESKEIITKKSEIQSNDSACESSSQSYKSLSQSASALAKSRKSMNSSITDELRRSSKGSIIILKQKNQLPSNKKAENKSKSSATLSTIKAKKMKPQRISVKNLGAYKPKYNFMKNEIAEEGSEFEETPSSRKNNINQKKQSFQNELPKFNNSRNLGPKCKPRPFCRSPTSKNKRLPKLIPHYTFERKDLKGQNYEVISEKDEDEQKIRRYDSHLERTEGGKVQFRSASALAKMFRSIQNEEQPPLLSKESFSELDSSISGL